MRPFFASALGASRYLSVRQELVLYRRDALDEYLACVQFLSSVVSYYERINVCSGLDGYLVQSHLSELERRSNPHQLY